MSEFEIRALAALERIVALLESREAGETNPLEVIHRHVHGATFTSGELAAHAARPANGELREALGESDSRQLGRLLGSIAGRPIGGFIAEAIGKEHGAVVWRVQACGSRLPLPIAREDNAVMLGVVNGGRKCG